MKRAFTLVEMLVVVVVITILMSIVFRLGAIIGDRTKRSQTIEKLHRVENCLSGYYAAYGSYPPVANYYKPNPYLEFKDLEQRQTDREVDSLDPLNVEMACRAQTVAARWPFDQRGAAYVDMRMAQALKFADQGKTDKSKPWMQAGCTGYYLANQFSDWENPNFQECAIFQFGLMSYLLPRYQLMGMELDSSVIARLDTCTQWTANNRYAANQDDGGLFDTWEDQLGGGSGKGSNGKKGRSKTYQRNLVERIPSEAVTARWLPNLELIVGTEFCPEGYRTFYGVKVSRNGTASGKYSINPDAIANTMRPFKGTGNNYYMLETATVYDGWDIELFYYSEPPYQGYRLWSAGPNNLTFCPGYPLEKLKNDADRKKAAEWMADDIVFMSH